jgi:hypothetical protein
MRSFKSFTLPVLIFGLGMTTGASAQEAPANGTAQADERRAIVLQPGERAMILTEMRQFLAGVQAITEASTREDAKAIAAAARPLGLKAAQEVPAPLRAKLPKDFKQFGFGVHSEFDQLAADAEALGDIRHSMTQLSGVLQKCVSCHAMFRLENEPAK